MEKQSFWRKAAEVSVVVIAALLLWSVLTNEPLMIGGLQFGPDRVPTGAVVAFKVDTRQQDNGMCPPGWAPADGRDREINLVGRFIMGGDETNQEKAGGSSTYRLGGRAFGIAKAGGDDRAFIHIGLTWEQEAESTVWIPPVEGNVSDDWNLSSQRGTHHPPYVALRYCVKRGSVAKAKAILCAWAPPLCADPTSTK